MKTLNLAVVIGLQVLSLSAFAGAGPSNGGGGDVVILPDDRVVLADSFLRSDAPQPNNMPPLRVLNPRLLQLAGAYANIGSPLFRFFGPRNYSEVEAEVRKLATRNSGLRFYAVQDQNELNMFCAPGGRKNYKLPTGYSVAQVACTAGNETFLVEPLFLRLSLRDQVLLLVHERLTTLRDKMGGKNYSAIARLTTGLNTYLDVYKEQTKSKYRVLNEDEVQKLTELYIAIEEIQYRDFDPGVNSFQWHAHAYGGGRVHSMASVDPTALVSLDSLAPANATLAARTKLIHSYITSNSRIELGEDVIIQDSNVQSVGVMAIGARTRISQSRVVFKSDFVVSEDQVLESGIIDSDKNDLYYPVGVVTLPFELSWKSQQEVHVITISEADAKRQVEEIASGGLRISAQVKDSSMRSLFSRSREYVMDVTMIISLRPEMNSDPRLYLIESGKFFKAGAKRFVAIQTPSVDSYDGKWKPLLSEYLNKLASSGLKYAQSDRYYSWSQFIEINVEFPVASPSTPN
jgi:hypothetical protein